MSNYETTTALTTNGCVGRLFYSESGTLFLARPDETHDSWNCDPASERVWVISFRESSPASHEFSEILELPLQKRIIKLSASLQQFFWDIFFKMASKTGEEFLCAADRSAWHRSELIDVIRWLVAQRNKHMESCRATDLRCLELWRTIYQHAAQSSSPEPMHLSKNASYDSLRHYFRKMFGVSPRCLLMRLRMNRAKQLLRTSNLSIKEVAQELGYMRQHEFARAFSRALGKSPSKWRSGADRA